MLKTFLKNNIFKNRGVSRLVITFPKYGFVIKIPNFTNSVNNFLLGLYCNHNERLITKDYEEYKEYDSTNYNKIAPSYYCGMFGIFLIQKYVRQLTEEEFQFLDKKYFYCITNDFTYRNFGFLDGRIVCLDYGNNY